jgi:hypothetical protein
MILGTKIGGNLTIKRTTWTVIVREKAFFLARIDNSESIRFVRPI